MWAFLLQNNLNARKTTISSTSISMHGGSFEITRLNSPFIWNILIFLTSNSIFRESGLQDYIGAFAVSAGFGTDELCKK